NGTHHLIHFSGEFGAYDLSETRTGATKHDLSGTVADFCDAVRPYPASAIGKWRKGGDQLQQVHLVGTESKAHFRREVGGDSESVGHCDDIADAGALRDLDGDRVDRLG